MGRHVDDIIDMWLASQENGSCPNKSADRIEAYRDLIATLIHNEKSVNLLLSRDFKNKVIDASMGERSKNFKGWKKLCARDWEIALVKCKITSGIKSGANFEYSGPKADPEVYEDGIKNDNDTENYISEKTSEEKDDIVNEEPNYTVLDKTLIKGLVEPEVKWDLEFCKLIGLDPNE